MDEPTEPLIICVPSKEYPDFPDLAFKQHGNQYTENVCDECNRGVWLGVNSAALAATGVKKVCPHCAMNKYYIDKHTKITTLTSTNQS